MKYPTKTPEPKKWPINLKLLSDDYALLKGFAQQDRRSITNYVLVVLLKHLTERKAKPPTT